MAGAGYKLFATGDVLTAAEVNTYLQQQVTMVFANSTARTTALSGVLAEGMMSYLQDTNTVEVYNGSNWVNVGNTGDVTEVQAGTGISVADGTGPIPIVTNTMATEIDAKGDLIVGTGADTFDRLAVGTDGYTLVADSSVSPTGLKWAAPASGGMTLLSTTSLSSTGVTISNIDQTYNDLFISLTGVDMSGNVGYVRIRPNNLTTGFFGSGTRFDDTTAGVISANDTEITNPLKASRASDGGSGNWSMYLYNYASTTRSKAALLTYGYRGTNDSSNTTRQQAGVIGGYYYTNSAMTSLTITLVPYAGSPTFSGGEVRIYGLK